MNSYGKQVPAMREKKESSRRDFLTTVATGTLTLALATGQSHQAHGCPAGHRASTEREGDRLPFLSDKKFVPVMVTPFTLDGRVDYDGLSRLTDFYLAAGAKGFFANCQSSEMFALTEEERLSITRHVVRHVSGAMPVVASGSFGESLEAKAEFAQKIYQTGINAVIMISGHFAGKKESDDVLISRFEKFFDLTGDIPMGTYECPRPYKRIITPSVFSYLLAGKRVIYHKDTTIAFDKVKVKIDLAKNSHLEFYDACTANTMRSLQAGAKGMSAVSGNFYPEILVWMCNNATHPDKQADVQYMQEQLTRAEAVIAKGYPASSKYFLQKRGLPIEPIIRNKKIKLKKKNIEALDAMYQTFLGWCDRIGIEPVKL